MDDKFQKELEKNEKILEEKENQKEEKIKDMKLLQIKLAKELE
jgi:hypothetical protein